jgi:hypothetical protein
MIEKAYSESTLINICAYELHKAFKSCRDATKVRLALIGHQRLQLKLTSQK